MPGGHQAQGPPQESPLGWGDALTQCRAGIELPGHGPISQIQQEAQEQQPAGVLILPGGGNATSQPLFPSASPHFSLVYPIY